MMIFAVPNSACNMELHLKASAKAVGNILLATRWIEIHMAATGYVIEHFNEIMEVVKIRKSEKTSDR